MPCRCQQKALSTVQCWFDCSNSILTSGPQNCRMRCWPLSRPQFGAIHSAYDSRVSFKVLSPPGYWGSDQMYWVPSAAATKNSFPNPHVKSARMSRIVSVELIERDIKVIQTVLYSSRCFMKKKVRKLFVKHFESVDRWRLLVIGGTVILARNFPFSVMCIMIPVLHIIVARPNTPLRSGIVDGVLFTMTAQICESVLKEMVKALAILLLAVTTECIMKQIVSTEKCRAKTRNIRKPRAVDQGPKCLVSKKTNSDDR